ncbi:PQQ-binding-like beta-propeller repeat protein [Roseimaritima sediminicola]|uniref:PQQ-binding-like beta-propeller repeat protein n=1 Tax=Roseimaritima sediminicola TaxID=2662066 RepID=UPI0012983BFF|nr:PQQ-binding-like beta-propeller repeat protein [Roseimaritima sediminicola]
MLFSTHVWRQAVPPRTVFLLLCLLWGAFAGSLSAKQTDAPYRYWTTADGKRSGVRLKVIQANATHVRLQREDSGKQVTFALDRLSAADQRYLRTRQTAATAPPSAPPSAAAADADQTPTADASARASSASAEHWPQWRGPQRDGKSPATGLLQRWPEAGPPLLWSVDGLGQGYSAPAVVEAVLYVLGTRDEGEYLFAMAVDDGRLLWESPLGAKAGGGGYPGPRSTPTVDGDRVFALGSDGTLVSVQRSSGQRLWSANLQQDFGGQRGHWDYAESPLIDGTNLICTPGGPRQTLVALNKNNGRLVWSSAVGPALGQASEDYVQAGYASCVLGSFAGTRHVIAFLHGGVVGANAKDGSPLWHYDAPANGTANCSTPVVQDGSVFAASGYGTGGGRAEIVRRGRQWNVQEKYFVNKMQSHHGGFVLHQGHLYGTNDSVLLCVDWESGRIRWQDRCVGKGSISYADGHLYVRGEDGEVALVEASPKKYRERGRFMQPERSGGKAWAHPVIAGGRLFLRDGPQMLCYQLRSDEAR